MSFTNVLYKTIMYIGQHILVLSQLNNIFLVIISEFVCLHLHAQNKTILF